MKKVVIASKNPVKIQSVKNGFGKMFPYDVFDFVGLSVPSNVSNQPTSSIEAYTGALNRVNNAYKEFKNADFYVGIEGGIERILTEMEAFAWIVTKSDDLYGKSKTGTFFLPKEVIKYIDQGNELGEADDIVFNLKNSKQQNGAVGILTADVIDRTKYYTDAVILSLIPFKNKSLY